MDYITSSICNYFKVSNNRAILIDGEWGSGKTFYAKNVLKDILRNELPNSISIYLSLYGLTSIEEVSNIIVGSLLTSNKKNSKTSKIKKLFLKTLNSAKNEWSMARVALNLFDEDDVIGLFTKKISNINVIFDDLERSTINHHEIMGFITNLCCLDKFNIVMIANEKEINSSHYHSNLELKYIAAASIFNKSNDSNSNSETVQYTDSSEKNAVDSINELTNSIFDSNLTYQEIKEKTVYRTYRFSTDISEVYDAIIKEICKKQDNYDFLINLKEPVVKEFRRLNISNLRTLESILLMFSDFSDPLLKSTSNQFFFSLIENMTENAIRIIHSISKPTHFLLDDHYYTFDYSHIFSYMKGVKFNLVKFEEEKNNYFWDLYYKSVNPFEKLRNFYFFNEDNISEAFYQIVDMATNSKFPIDKVNLLIYIVVYLNQIGFDFPVDDLIDKLKINENYSKDFFYDQFGIEIFKQNLHINISEESEKKFNSYMKKLSSKYLDNIDLQIQSVLVDYFTFNNEDDVYELYLRNKDSIEDMGGWLYLVPIDQILVFLDRSSNLQFISLMRTINHIFFYDDKLSN